VAWAASEVTDQAGDAQRKSIKQVAVKGLPIQFVKKRLSVRLSDSVVIAGKIGIPRSERFRHIVRFLILPSRSTSLRSQEKQSPHYSQRKKGMESIMPSLPALRVGIWRSGATHR
jgi:hypothetical protein